MFISIIPTCLQYVSLNCSNMFPSITHLIPTCDLDRENSLEFHSLWFHVI